MLLNNAAFSFNRRYEKFFFYAVIVLHLIPVLTLHYFVTRDGPAHLYNSNLINHILFKPGGISSFFFEFTPYINANWTGHILLCTFNFFLPAMLAEKLILGIYVILFLFAFRSFISAFNHIAIASSYLI